ncbi:MAG: aminotransferase class IV, partial [Actinobacteria bacterium]|nr:aminotransferase class IV [Actinomycetota bacterium]
MGGDRVESTPVAGGCVIWRCRVVSGEPVTSVWFNGALCDQADVQLSPFDHGLLTGDGIFETLKVVGGKVFAVRRHYERLLASAAGLGLTGGVPAEDDLRRAMAEVVGANDVVEGRVRVTITGGPSPLGSDRGTASPTVLVAATSMNPWPPTSDVVVVPWPRNERGALAGMKTISYGENVVALAYAHEQGAAEALFPNTVGNLCEGTGTNVFAAFDGRLVTPPLASGCLAGVTRALVLETTGAVEEDIPVETLLTADEAFLTSTTRDVQPIRAIDGTHLPAAPGPLTIEAMAAFTALSARDL